MDCRGSAAVGGGKGEVSGGVCLSGVRSSCRGGSAGGSGGRVWGMCSGQWGDDYGMGVVGGILGVCSHQNRLCRGRLRGFSGGLQGQRRKGWDVCGLRRGGGYWHRKMPLIRDMWRLGQGSLYRAGFVRCGLGGVSRLLQGFGKGQGRGEVA